MKQKSIQNEFQAILSLKPSGTCFNCSIALLFLLIFQTGFGQYNFTELDELIASKSKALGGKVVAAIVMDGKVVYKKEIGEDFKIETAEPIGSSSKWLTAALVMTFVDKGELKLDDPVSKYIPVFATYSKSFITIRQCLQEITGVESEQRRIARVLQKKKFETLEEQVNYYASHKDIINSPGKEFFYGEVGYNTVGRVLEVIAKKKTFAKLMQERITKPCGMKKTTFQRDNGAEDPAEGAVATAGDYLKFMTMLLNDGEINGKKVLSKEAIREMETARDASIPVKYSPKLMQDYSYGYGAWLGGSDKFGKATVVASPGVNGTWPYLDRCRKYACVVLTRQTDNEQTSATFLDVKDIIESQIKGECR